MKRFSMLIIISIFIISTSFEIKHKGKNSIRFLEWDEETDLNMTYFEEEVKLVKPAKKPILLGFTSKNSDDGKNVINIFFKNIKDKFIFKNYIYFLINYIPNTRRRRLNGKSVKKALKGELQILTLEEDIVEYEVKHEYYDMESFNLEKNIQFLDKNYTDLEEIQKILEKSDDDNTDVMFTPDFIFNSDNQNFNKKSLLFFEVNNINRLQNSRIEIIGQFSNDYYLKKNQLKKKINFTCINCDPVNTKIEAHFQEYKNTDNYSLIFHLSKIIKINLEGAYADLIFDERRLRNLQNNNKNKRLFLSEGNVEISDIEYVSTILNPKNKKNEGLAGGAIAGIVIACVVLLIGATVFALIFVRKKKVISNSSAIDLFNSSTSLNK